MGFKPEKFSTKFDRREAEGKPSKNSPIKTKNHTLQSPQIAVR